MTLLVGLLLIGILGELCGGSTICQITREGVCQGKNITAGVFNETTFNGTVCLQRASYYQSLCQNNGVTTAKVLGSGVSLMVGNFCNITRNGSCPILQSIANSTFRDYYGEKNLNATSEVPCLNRALGYQNYCGNTGSTTAYFGGSGFSRRYPYYCEITRNGYCSGSPNLSNKTFQAIKAEDISGAKVEGPCLQHANYYQTKCGNTGSTMARYVPNGHAIRVPQYCIITIEGTCVKYTANTNRTFQDISGEDLYNAKQESNCLSRALGYYTWCGGNVVTSAQFVPSRAKKYAGNVCLITRIGNCPKQPTIANTTFRDTYGENYHNATVQSQCFKRAIDYQCFCNNSGTTVASFGTNLLNFTSTLCCYPPKTTCGSSCVNLKSDNNNCGSCGNVCSVGYICVNSSCVQYCFNGNVLCGTSCVDLTYDDNNCGACGTVCPAGEYCGQSQCVGGCYYDLCGTSCVDLTSDPHNCGNCGSSCSSQQVCVGRTCVGNGYLRFTITWNAYGDGDILVTTPNNSSLFYNNRGPGASTDYGFVDVVTLNGYTESMFWSYSSVTPPAGTYYVCFAETPIDLFYLIDYTLFVEINKVTQSFIGQTTASAFTDFTCTPSHPLFVASVTYP